MKKVILGTGLYICGTLGLLFYFSLVVSGGAMSAFYLSSVSLAVGVILNIQGFREDKKK